jgi:hypothetical protein
MTGIKKTAEKLGFISLGFLGYTLLLPQGSAGHFRTWSLVPRFDIPSLFEFWLVPMIIAATLVVLIIVLAVSASRKTAGKALIRPVAGVYLIKAAIPPVFFLALIFALLSMQYFEVRFLLLGAYISFVALILGLSIRSWRETKYEIRGDMVITREGLLKKKVLVTGTEELRGVLVKKPSILDYLFDTGSVILRTRGGRITWHAVAFPEQIMQRIEGVR